MMILVKFPTRERPERFGKVLSRWVETAADRANLHFLITLDHDDPAALENAAKARTILAASMVNGTIVSGYSKGKIHAVNRDMEHAPEWDILLVVSDDMWPVVEGWDRVIREQFARTPDSLVWFFDGSQRDICTLPLMDRAYYGRFGYIYHPSYLSVFADDESTDDARFLGRLVFVDIVLAEHRHPANTHEVRPDALYRKNETTTIWDRDRKNYYERKLKKA